ncbi:MAG: hypothetical protein EA417_00870 [Gammaproteobacteria bacterium]|nr:MAG: hypothetical protein EA417_00870 [Gammaproteobacteria bacterium]
MRYIVSLTVESRREHRLEEVLALLDAVPEAKIVEGRGRNAMKVDMSPEAARHIREEAGSLLTVTEPVELNLLGKAG